MCDRHFFFQFDASEKRGTKLTRLSMCSIRMKRDIGFFGFCGFCDFCDFTAVFRFLSKFLSSFYRYSLLLSCFYRFYIAVLRLWLNFLRFCGFLNGPKCPLIHVKKRLHEYIIPNE